MTKALITISKPWSIIREDLISIGKGLLINLAGAALLVFGNYLADLIQGVEISDLVLPISVSTALLAAIANTIRKFVSKQEYIK